MINVYPEGEQYLDSETGLISPAKGVDGVPASVGYEDMIGIGLIPGHELFEGYGQRESCSTITTGNDIWEGTSTTCPIPDQTVGEQMTILCANAADTNGGTGVNTLDVHGLDAAGNPQSEIVILNGGSVNTVRMDWRFIQSIHAQTVGTNGTAVGIISIHRTGDATRVYNVIKPGGNMSLNSARMVPAGKTFYMKVLNYSAAANKSISLRLRSTTTFENTLTTGNFFLFKDTAFLLDSTISRIFPIPRKYIALGIVKATVYSTVAGGDASVSYGGWIE